MDWVNRFLGRGVLRQLGFFTIINILIFIVCIFVYLMVCKYSGDVSANPWDAIRLFVDSNSITGYDYKLSFANVVLLITVYPSLLVLLSIMAAMALWIPVQVRLSFLLYIQMSCLFRRI
jgi:hypothetical protein